MQWILSGTTAPAPASFRVGSDVRRGGGRISARVGPCGPRWKRVILGGTSFRRHRARSGRVRAALVLAALTGASCLIADPVWLVGGGPDVYASQAQIEANVLWAREVIDSLPGRREVRVWFTDGADPAPDVVEWRAPAESRASMQPLARVMDSAWGNGQSYRNHRISGVRGGTEANRLVRELRAVLEGLPPGGGAWLVFNGHGTYAEDLNNGIELWENSQLRVDDLDALLDLAPPGSRVRFLFTQCYAGAFGRLARPGTGRCGFVAEAADREAEGCSAAVDTGDFQDYSTHFFAALAGRNRDGTPLIRDPDRDADGRVSPLEAHYHTLLAAHSSDLPRATSELLLEQWDAWYLAPATAVLSPGDDHYAELARELMQRTGLTEEGVKEGALSSRRRRLENEHERLLQELERVRHQTEELRAGLEEEVLRRWPRSGYAYTQNYRHFLVEDLDNTQDYLLAQPEYTRMVRGQKRQQRLDGALLENRRAATRLEKIEHLLRLSRLLRILESLGPATLRERYRELVECETALF
jgi:hypothetical protein